MKLTSTGIVDGVIQDKYGKRGSQFTPKGMPNFSLPFAIHDAPAGTVSFALLLEDKDAAPVCGFSWIHWLAANITDTDIPENASIATNFVQGANSWAGALENHTREEASYYGGMAPPDAPHLYELHVYALDCTLDLQNGFYLNALFRAMEGHVLAQATLKGSYAN